MRAIPRQVTSALHADVLWSMGHTGIYNVLYTHFIP